MTNEELVSEIKAGRAGYGELWQQVHAFVRQQAARYIRLNAGLCVGAGVEFDDLLQAGFLALHDAVNGYDLAAGMAFVGYLSFHLKRYFRSACGIRTNKHDPLLQAARLDRPVNEEEGAATLGELTPDPHAEAQQEDVEERLFREQLHNALENAMDTLNNEQADIIRRRYWQSDTLDAIAADTGVSRERVRQIERKALQGLRKCTRILQPFHDEIISHFAWRGTGLQAWRDTGVSSVERAAEKTEALMQRIQEQREREKTSICALLHIAPEEYDRRFREYGEGSPHVVDRLY